MQAPAFDYVPIISDKTKAKLKVVSLKGLSTAHDSTHSDGGRLYGKVSAGYTLELFADVGQSVRVLSGTCASLNTYFSLTGESGNGLSGRAVIESFIATDDTLIVIPTFAVDEDVMFSIDSCRKLPGYDATYGLGRLHAKAMREILASALPAKLPNLYGGKGLAGFVPGARGVELPDLTLLANPDQLRIAQGELVKAYIGREAETAEEWAKVMEGAFERYQRLMDAMEPISVKEAEAAASESANLSGVSVGTWRRG